MPAFEQLELAAGTIIPQLDEYNSLNEKESDIFSQLNKDDQFKLILKWPLPMAPEIIPVEEEPKPVEKTPRTYTIKGKTFQIPSHYFTERIQYESSLQRAGEIPLYKFIQEFVTPFLDEQLSTPMANSIYTEDVQIFKDEAAWDEKDLKTQIKNAVLAPLKEKLDKSLDVFSQEVYDDQHDNISKFSGMSKFKIIGKFETEAATLKYLGYNAWPSSMLCYIASSPEGTAFPVQATALLSFKFLTFNLSASYKAILNPEEHARELMDLQRRGEKLWCCH